MLLSHNWLKSYYTNPEAMPEPKKVAELFTMRAFEVEGVEEKGDDTIYDIKLTADRAPYAYAMRYVALELSLLVPELNMDEKFLRFAKTDISLAGISSVVNTDLVTEAAQEFCPMYSLTKIEGVANTESPSWLKTALESIGQQSRGYVVDLTNYVMFDSGQPLHAFDVDKITGQIRVDISTEGEKVTILGGREIALATGTLVIRDDSGILAIAGVKGGVKAEVDGNTKNIYLEAASFNAPKVRRTARSLNLLNDSSKRFEQNITSERFLTGQQAYISLIGDAQISPMQTSKDIAFLSDESVLRKINVDVSSVAVSINKEDSTVSDLFISFIENTLPKTGAKVENVIEGKYRITQPLYRSDLLTQADVADEFMRNVGYEFLTYTEPVKSKVTGLQDPIDKLIAVLRNFFITKGFDEVMLHTLVDSKVDAYATVLANALTSERNSLRSSLNLSMEQVLETNLKHLDMVGKKVVQLFEIGNVFSDKKTEVLEKMHLVFGVSMIKWPKGQSSELYLKNIISELEVIVGTIQNPIFGKNTVEIDLEQLVSTISPETLTDLLTKITPKKLSGKVNYKKASIYPAMSRDIAFFGSTDQEVVKAFIKSQVEKYALIENYFCFDVFTKEDKTSYGYRFVFQSYEKTLTEEEVGVIMNEIAEAVKAQGWEVR